jgi:phosphatidylglycerol:prolipoprotein diacylglycerol transferase
MNPVALKIGPFAIYWYGILVVLSVLAGAYAATWQARRRGQDPEHVWNALLLCLILGIVGARIYHVFSTSQGGTIGWSYYRAHPQDILKIWQGGLGLLGAIAGGAVGMVIYARLAHLPILTWLDIGSYGLLLAQAIGRWGNYINQELYGPPTTLPWGIHIDAPYRIVPYNNLIAYPLNTRFHPVFLYEFLWCLVGFGLLWWITSRLSARLLEGDAFLLYLIWYPVGRFMIEFLRPDAWMWGKIAAAQVFTAATALVAGTILIFRHVRFQRQAGNTGDTPSAAEAVARSEDDVQVDD